ncbi:hypothetical protein IT882_03120 [Microbacterium schleiferi]|uniref:Uncharacterized protein n=1 Tax=Microbacterium schleiferi TaxID=69362 RepID=A0A7S8MXP2_9MICO|nr:DUF6350 family protein [Microbacterium schleiferi]QPE05109.1 hypothetical protein IT882_03120 [Microbacterium schleiferi]
MNRVIVFLLAAFDALVTVAAGLVVVLAPATLLWVVEFGGLAPWDALWPTAATIWQLGHVVPQEITLPADYVATAGIDPAAAPFMLSLAPLAFAGFTAISAARSGRRASRSGAAFTGAIAGTVVFAAAAAGIALTGANAVANSNLTEAILFPALIFGIPAILGALVGEWQDADRGIIAALRERTEDLPEDWSLAPTVIARAGAITVVGLIGVAALATAVVIFARGSQIVGLYEASNVDVLGAVVLTLGQLLYLPTLVVWALAFVAGPGVSLGAGSTVAASGTTTGVLPGVPLLGALPESTSPWLLLLALLPVGVGAFAGWVARSSYAADAERISARIATTLGIAVFAAGSAAILAVLASGSLGPGTLAQVGPEAGPVALAIGVEVGVSAGILLLSPRRRARDDGASASPPAALLEPSID